MGGVLVGTCLQNPTIYTRSLKAGGERGGVYPANHIEGILRENAGVCANPKPEKCNG